MSKSGYNDEFPETCANCGKTFTQSHYGSLCDAILRRKPFCSYECNRALGQTSPIRERQNNNND